jgi:hypothetical protein
VVGQQYGGIRYSGDTLENVSFLLTRTATVGTDPFYPLDNSPYSPYPAKFLNKNAQQSVTKTFAFGPLTYAPQGSDTIVIGNPYASFRTAGVDANPATNP